MMTGAVVRANNTKKKSLTLNFVHVQTDVYVCVCAYWKHAGCEKRLPSSSVFFIIPKCVFLHLNERKNSVLFSE